MENINTSAAAYVLRMSDDGNGRNQRYRLEAYTAEGYQSCGRAYKTPENAMRGLKDRQRLMSLYYTVGRIKIEWQTDYRVAFVNKDYKYRDGYFFKKSKDVREFLRMMTACGHKLAAIVGDPEFNFRGDDVTADFLPIGKATERAKGHMTDEKYTETFGEVSEDDNYLTARLMLPADVMETAQAAAAAAEVDLSKYLEELILDSAGIA